MKSCGSMPIVGGVQMGHSYINPKNNASKGMVADMPMKTNIPAKISKKFNSKNKAMKSESGKE